MVVPDQMAVRAGALQPPNSMLTQPPVTSVSSQSAATVSDQREPARPATPVKDQSGRRLAAEQHLIQQVQGIFPQLTRWAVNQHSLTTILSRCLPTSLWTS